MLTHKFFFGAVAATTVATTAQTVVEILPTDIYNGRLPLARLLDCLKNLQTENVKLMSALQQERYAHMQAVQVNRDFTKALEELRGICNLIQTYVDYDPACLRAANDMMDLIVRAENSNASFIEALHKFESADTTVTDTHGSITRDIFTLQQERNLLSDQLNYAQDELNSAALRFDTALAVAQKRPELIPPISTENTFQLLHTATDIIASSVGP